MDILTQASFTTSLAASASTLAPSVTCSAVSWVDGFSIPQTTQACSFVLEPPQEAEWWQHGIVPTIAWGLAAYSVISFFALLAMWSNGTINWKLTTNEHYIDDRIRRNSRYTHRRRAPDPRTHYPSWPLEAYRAHLGSLNTPGPGPVRPYHSRTTTQPATVNYPIRPQRGVEAQQPVQNHDREHERGEAGTEVGTETGTGFSSSSLTTEERGRDETQEQFVRRQKMRRLMAFEQALIRQHCL